MRRLLGCLCLRTRQGKLRGVKTLAPSHTAGGEGVRVPVGLTTGQVLSCQDFPPVLKEGTGESESRECGCSLRLSPRQTRPQVPVQTLLWGPPPPASACGF